MSERIHLYNYDILCTHHYNSTELASGIASTALQCGTRRCRTDNDSLSKPVLITIQHSEMLKVSVTITFLLKEETTFFRCSWMMIILVLNVSFGSF